jgi:hypothetical protein
LQHLEAQGIGHVSLPSVHAPAPHQLNPSAAAWSSDFQRLTLSTPRPQFQSHNQVHPQQQQLNGGWHREFTQQQAQSQNQSYANHPGYNGVIHHQGLQQVYSGPLSMTQPQQAQVPQAAEAFDEEAFARAFEEAAKSETTLVDTAAQERPYEVGVDIMLNESTERFMRSGPPEQDRIGADLIHDPAREGLQDQQDPDALAITAGQLLDSVGDNQSEKFQNSKFLKLMRQLRDREVTVEGDKIVARPSNDREAAEVVSP